MALHKAASTHNPSRIEDRMQAAGLWRDQAALLDHGSQLDAYIVSLGILDAAITRSRSLEEQYSQLTSNNITALSKDVAVDGAALAISLGNLEIAVEMLEQGRATLFTQLGRYRTVLDGR